MTSDLKDAALPQGQWVLGKSHTTKNTDVFDRNEPKTFLLSGIFDNNHGVPKEMFRE